jgi:putative aldouronate transport system permease protein
MTALWRRCSPAPGSASVTSNSSSAFWQSLENTLTITAFQLVFFFPMPIAFAILVNGVLSTKVRTFIQTAVYVPHFCGWMLVVTFFVQMLCGAGLLSQKLRQGGADRRRYRRSPATATKDGDTPKEST